MNGLALSFVHATPLPSSSYLYFQLPFIVHPKSSLHNLQLEPQIEKKYKQGRLVVNVFNLVNGSCKSKYRQESLNNKYTF